MPSSILVDTLKDRIKKQEVYALIDVREKPAFASGHISGATNLPRRELEFSASQKIPNKHIPIILYDDNGGRAMLSARTLEKQGFNSVVYLAEGLDAWTASGNTLVKGVNRPGKAFGEQVAVDEKVPQVPPGTLKRWLDRNENIVVIDVRPPAEVNRFGGIPGSVNIQGFDLVSRIFDYANRYDKIIVTCAGRTRGIISAQTLMQMGVKQVYDLHDGTMGWRLAGFQLEKPIPEGLPPSREARKAAEAFALRLLEKNDIKRMPVETLQRRQISAAQNILYLFDVRAPDEFAKGHIPGAVSLPGGQAVQCADDFIAVRQGDIVFVSNHFSRALITAFWFKKMGFPSVYALDGGVCAWTGSGRPLETGQKTPLPPHFAHAASQVENIAPAALKNKMDRGIALSIINVDDSQRFREGHIPGSCWIPRGRLELQITEAVANAETIILTCKNGIHSILAGATLMEMDYPRVFALEGGTDAWAQAGFAIETGLTGVTGEPDDVYLKPYERGREAMEEYLRWEKELLDRQ